MASGPPLEEDSSRRAIGGDLVLPLAGLAFTLYYFWTIIDSPWTAQVSAFFIGIVLIALIGIFLVKTGLAVWRGAASMALGALGGPRYLLPIRLGFFALTLAYLLLIEWGGFTLTTFAFLASAMLLLGRGRRAGLIIALSAILSLVGYFLFIAAFDARFPKGPFEAIVQALA